MTTLREERRKLFDEIDIDRTEYTPDQGMPSPIYHINDAQMDYVVESLLQAQRTADLEAIREGVKGKERYDAWLHGFNVDMTNGYNIALSDTLSLIEQIMNKEI